MTVLSPAARRLASLVFSLALLVPARARAQDDVPRPRSNPPLYWGANVSTATLSGLLQGRPGRLAPWRAFAGGLAGGTLMYAGQRMVGTGAPALRFAGLQTVATGASVARNISLARGALSELTFPIFPLYVRVHARGRPRVGVRLSLLAVGGVVQSVHEFRVWPDWDESLLAGMPVFAISGARIAPCEQFNRGGYCVGGGVGHHVLGAIAYTTTPAHFSARNVLTHELGHAAQDVRDVVLHAVPASDFVLGLHPVGRAVARFLVIDVALPLNVVSRAVGPARDPGCRDAGTFYECETEAMMPALP